MLKSIKLKNYRKYEDAAFDFTAGLVTLRAPNEHGKSTLLEAIGYALMGSKMLSEPLSDVVSYGKGESSLEVSLVVEMEGVEYTFTRRKSGAEVSYGDQLVTGQVETRAWAERLFGCTAEQFKQLVFASQNDVRGILEDRADSGKLVEALADLGQIDQLIEKIQAQLPTGSTKTLEGQLTALAVEEALPAAPSRDPVDAAQAELDAKVQGLQDLKDPAREVAFKAAQAILKAEAAAEAEQVRIASRIAELEKVQEPAPCEVSDDQLQQAKALAADEARLATLRKAYTTVFPPVEESWEDTAEAFKLFKEVLTKQLPNARSTLSDLKVERASKLAMLINEKTCSFCKKDISELPEVAQVNSEVMDAVKNYDAAIASAQALIAELEDQLQSCAAIEEATATYRKLAGSFWRLEGGLPGTPVWIGDVPPPPGELPDVAGMEAKLRAHRAACARYDAARLELADLQAAVQPVTRDEDAARIVAEFSSYSAAVAAAEAEVAAARSMLAAARTSYEGQLAAWQMLHAAAQKRKEQFEATRKLLEETNYHNEMCKRLREARESLRKRVWQIVCSAVSTYFSAVRGTDSSVSHDGTTFTVNGRTVKGLSGSTKDMLGLAIRAGLVKTFLPSMPILILDEVFAGCDETRETAGLGTIASLNFPQVLLVTHSDLADSFSDKIITL